MRSLVSLSVVNEPVLPNEDKTLRKKNMKDSGWNGHRRGRFYEHWEMTLGS